ncbi:TatD family hydrolase [Clostridioides difficile]|nr:TatD family hydrolase [Clostridioides difficile]
MNIYGSSKYVKFAIGYNPKIINNIPFSKKSFNRNIVKTEYIGEVGLDFKNVNSINREKQLEIFDYISSMAAKVINY